MTFWSVEDQRSEPAVRAGRPTKEGIADLIFLAKRRDQEKNTCSHFIHVSPSSAPSLDLSRPQNCSRRTYVKASSTTTTTWTSRTSWTTCKRRYESLFPCSLAVTHTYQGPITHMASPFKPSLFISASSQRAKLTFV